MLFLSARESWDTCDNLNVAGKDVQLIVTDFSETAGENCTILKSCLASQNPDGLHSEENIGEYDCRNESLSTPNVLPCTYDKPLSFLALNVCGILSKMKCNGVVERRRTLTQAAESVKWRLQQA